ncbi:glutamate-5-semialdehyde dehydrogenase [Desulfotalea psychrophila]|uniref:Gamma-glutamyl phosphate reductase n=1 Tax=Desulfotalea psychrophila (strain LSv54 / DSM 12343) TaxID=177439 RepID=PROA_DESPS|nr:glutamate-5-semialdehyde dehydrogenase [Desulfotalea psychrophila]Q6AK09.1 RecName: Full=Gamma-glutamyl phosphate reductase; Short=GPR; AltName: Full=Glutamate-5-semialdehyde dehydrogenase; AltName: Full=Glutamyl-gamma-semialdehyde dehydrogenase; Short=GSA dehydrogenase [Desulfotalea psychrophila LSv54]CAG37317.1 probable gamma-glutamyl phosphate reductase [Desulfotalea psychrophila LSv54]
MTLEETIVEVGVRAKAAAADLMSLATRQKDAVLSQVGELLVAEKAFLQEENEKDLAAGREKGLSDAMLDRLALTDSVIESMVKGLKEVIALPDPVGRTLGSVKRPNGLSVGRMCVPLGVIAMIYESRPNVTIDAAALCLKAGNAIILRGGSEAIHSNLALASILRRALEEAEVNPDSVQVIPMIDREAITIMLGLEDSIDLVIPRGGEGLIRFVSKNSSIPVLKHYKGVCHAYIDKDADLAKVAPIVINAKTQRPGVCNALEGILIHEDIVADVLPGLATELAELGVEMRGCSQSLPFSEHIVAASEEDWGTEFLRLCLCVKVVRSFEDAKSYIRKYGSQHTEAIITENYTTAHRFVAEVDASAVVVNASTRFNDGGELGLGAEIGISTTKLHAYGPMGLEELTTKKFVILGDGQIRS